MSHFQHLIPCFLLFSGSQSVPAVSETVTRHPSKAVFWLCRKNSGHIFFIESFMNGSSSTVISRRDGKGLVVLLLMVVSAIYHQGDRRINNGSRLTVRTAFHLNWTYPFLVTTSNSDKLLMNKLMSSSLLLPPGSPPLLVPLNSSCQASGSRGRGRRADSKLCNIRV